MTTLIAGLFDQVTVMTWEKTCKAYEFLLSFMKTFQSSYSVTHGTLRVISEGCRWGGLVEFACPGQYRRAELSLVVFCTAAHGPLQVRQKLL